MVNKPIAEYPCLKAKKQLFFPAAWILRVEIIDQAMPHIPEPLKKHYNHIPWDELAGLKGLMTESQERYNFEKVWDFIKNKMPEIGPQIDQIIIDVESVGK